MAVPHPDLIPGEAGAHLPWALWRVDRFGREVQRPGEHYWWENKNRHPYGDVVFQYTDAGSATLRSRGVKRRVPAGCAMIFRYGEDTGYGLGKDDTDPYQCTWVALSGAGVDEHWQAFRSQHGSVVELGKHSQVLKRLNRAIDLAHQRSEVGSPAMALATFAFMVELFATVEQKRSARLSPVQRAVEFILANPLGSWSLKEVSHRFEVSREHLTRIFTEQVGQAPYSWANEHRLEHALTLLRDSDLSLAVVAEQAGYTSTHTLSRQVRAQTGCGPSTYRARCRAG